MRDLGRRAAVAAALAIGLSAAAPISQPAQRPSPQARVLALRAQGLQARIEKRHGPSAADGLAFDRLVADVTAYNRTFSRWDVSVQRAVQSTAPPGRTAFGLIVLGGPRTCKVNCSFFPDNRPPGYFCLPDGTSFCNPDTGLQVCSWKCVKIPLSDLF